MEDKGIHPVVELLLARMESHPHEFEVNINPDGNRSFVGNRWYAALETIEEYGSDADQKALDASLGKIRMDEAHRWALDELLNGEQRRREELVTAQQQKAFSLLAQSANAAQLLQPLQAQYGAQLGTLSNAVTPYANSLSNAPVANSAVGDTGLVANVKKALGI
jgi:molybdenum-dependent DNA-binding transcriptional regulator ModE